MRTHAFGPALSLTILGALAGPALAQTIVVDDQDGAPTFTTTGDDWTTWSTNGMGWSGGDSSYHYLSHTVGGSDRRGTATWAPDLPVAGEWHVETWFRRTENRTSDADYFVHDASGAVTHHVLDQRGDGGSGWVDLGTYPCDAGPGGCFVVLDGTDDDQSDEANAVRFVLVSEGPTEDPDPPEEPDPCAEFPGLGEHAQEAFAPLVSAEGWENSDHASAAPDGQEAHSPNADLGEYLEGSGFDLCDPPGEEIIDSVLVAVRGRTQYQDGPYAVRMRLDAGGASEEVWNGTQAAWHEVDVTADLGDWTWGAAGLTQVRVHLLDHPGGNRDADVWVDAFRVTVHYTTTEGPEPADDDDDDEPEPEVDDDDDEEPPREEPAAEVDEPTAPGSDEACGCGGTLDSGAASASLFLLLPIARRRR